MSAVVNLICPAIRLIDSYVPQCFEEDHLVSLDPIKQFGDWFDLATKCPGVREPNAMCIATATK